MVSIPMLVDCGCVYILSGVRQYLPQVDVEAYTTVLSTTSRTTLTQVFVNPGKETLKEIRYVFPLYDGVSVVGFTCTIGDRILTGVVKERDQAKHEYKEAVDRGETAGLLEQSFEAGDVFTTSLGNVGPGEKVKVEITFIGELKHDAEVDGVRFMLPSKISPRYGSAPSLDGTAIKPKGIKFTLDAEVPEGSTITAIRSPSHPIAVSVGTTSTTEGDAPSLRKASVSLALESVVLGDDIIIQIIASNSGEPSAVVERHPTVETQALMVTLVPKFTLPAEKPEIVFLCDRSGSMHNTINDLKAALRIFLKSLPVGVKFNICSFGSNYSFLWPKSKSYNQQSLQEASAHIETFGANFGGTEMYEPMEATFKQRFNDMNLEVFLLTDGEIWDQERLFELINKNVAESKGAIRVFTLGVGLGASTSLIEGVARAGNGFAQTTAPNEKMDKKVVRMLKGSLFPHINDYTLEVKYHKPDMSDDDFELVEKISDALVISQEDSAPASSSTPTDTTEPASAAKKVVSLFQRDLKDDSAELNSEDKFGTDKKFDHLPAIEVPRYLQTPTEIPALYPFNRTTAYVIINDRSSVPKSVILKGTSQAGPLELEIPVTQLKDEGATIHQLAARREMKELEEDRGWLSFAKDKSGKLLKTENEGRFSDLVEREAVRLGTTYHVAGKYTSLVAIQQDSDKSKEAEIPTDDGFRAKTARDPPGTTYSVVTCAHPIMRMPMAQFGSPLGAPPAPVPSNFGPGQPRMRHAAGGLFGAPEPQASGGGFFGNASAGGNVSGGRSLFSFGSAAPPPPPSAPIAAFGSPAPFSKAAPRPPPPPPGASALGFGSAFGGQPADLAAAKADIDRITERGYEMPDRDWDKSEAFKNAQAPLFGSMVMPTPDEDEDDDFQGPSNVLEGLIALQSFVGSWSWSPKLQRILSVGPEAANTLAALPPVAKANGGNNDIFATACAIAFIKKKLSAEKDVWEMIVDKAEGWLEEGGQIAGLNAFLLIVETLF